MDAHAVFEIGSIKKLMTALLLADMTARGEVAVDAPVAKFLPASVTVRERGRPITLLDLATYNCGLPKLPGNLPRYWWAIAIHSPITRSISSMSSLLRQK
jgi:D-alanyl-D-alanine-carboxypeptidase/D-alanyl-D-alanine-endopeptidase